jgi:hypothetical protein
MFAPVTGIVAWPAPRFKAPVGIRAPDNVLLIEARSGAEFASVFGE